MPRLRILFVVLLSIVPPLAASKAEPTLRTPVAALAPEVAVPAILTVRSADGTDLLVVQEGDPTAPGILMIHGFAQSYLSFRRQFGSDLTRCFHLVSFDLRGHGGSAKPSDPAAYSDVARSADDVAAVIKATGLHRPVIVAWSYGGIVVGDYIRKYGPGNVAGIVFAGTLGGLVKPVAASLPVVALTPTKRSDLAATIKAAAINARSPDLAQNIGGGDVISHAYLTPAMTAEDQRILFATEMMLPAYVRRAMLQRSYDNSDLIAAFAPLPTLFVRGDHDMGMGEPELAVLATKLPRMKLSRYPGAGHLTFFEDPARFNTELAAFALAFSAKSPDPAASIPRPNLPMTSAAHQAFRDREFAARDLNGNGILEPFEIEAASGTPLLPEMIARAIRVNCGAALPNCPLARFRKQGHDEFKRVDRNHDGIVTAEELKAAGGSFHTESP